MNKKQRMIQFIKEAGKDYDDPFFYNIIWMLYKKGLTILNDCSVFKTVYDNLEFNSEFISSDNISEYDEEQLGKIAQERGLYSSEFIKTKISQNLVLMLDYWYLSKDNYYLRKDCAIWLNPDYNDFGDCLYE